MAITTLLQTQIIDGIGSIVISNVSQDQSNDQWNGQYTRTITIYGPPAAITGVAPVLFTLVLYSTVEANIELIAPQALF